MSQSNPQQSTDEMLGDLARCERTIGYIFLDKELLRSALTHASGAHHRVASNERLEFLGDAILGALVCEELYRRYPEYLEGDLTRIKSMVVSRQTCAKISGELGLEQFLILGKGMASHPSVPPSLLSDVFESLVAAVFLDGGDGAARDLIARFVYPEIESVAKGESGANYKSQLQQLVQREHGTTPTYQVVAESGPDHSKNFKVAADICGKEFPPAWGRNKKEAEQCAAMNALSAMDDKPIPYPSSD